MRLLKLSVVCFVAMLLAWPVMGAEDTQGGEQGQPEQTPVPECAEFKTLERYMAARPKWN